ncbi:bifunctional 3-(3-hydroxy-phenyl)propionate/3-hydroxycinnamic acid hydroxylase [Streptosporangium sp. G11]|uniref:bifunctional 3-(3-hydroxy-phenyl)propionate/3-hydroxycinnamic acid hydroxylase MhpA n=1 Tax=Streptosporangium sp. G11 TaxID=3436926 RepID=UPI003EC0DFB1
MTGSPEAGRLPVVIVGAGPTGMTAAALLARHGVPSVVCERHPEPYPLPRAVHLDDEVLRILQNVGVAEEFLGISMPAEGLRLVGPDLSTIAEFRRDRPVGDHGWPQANMFDQPELERLLRANLATLPAVEFRPGTLVEDVENVTGGPGPVRVSVLDTATGRRSRIWSAAVLGCDGANSTVRTAIGATLKGGRFAERWLVVDARSPRPLRHWNGVHQLCAPDAAATYMRVGEDRHRWEFQIGRHPLSGLETLLSPWLGDVAFGELRILRQAEYTFRAKVADRWRRGRVFLLGDAAHLTPPFIGQGMGSGLRDAANLCWKLALVLTGGADERLLDTYQAERAAHVRSVIGIAVTVGWIMTSPSPSARLARRLVATASRHLPFLQARLAGTALPRLPDGPLVRRAHDPLAGALCPQPWIAVEGETRRLDDLIGGSFALLHSGPLVPELAAVASLCDARTVRAKGELARWLARAGADSALVRPDGIVLASATTRTRRQRFYRFDDAWTRLMPVRGRGRPTFETTG